MLAAPACEVAGGELHAIHAIVLAVPTKFHCAETDADKTNTNPAVKRCFSTITSSFRQRMDNPQCGWGSGNGPKSVSNPRFSCEVNSASSDILVVELPLSARSPAGTRKAARIVSVQTVSPTEVVFQLKVLIRPPIRSIPLAPHSCQGHFQRHPSRLEGTCQPVGQRPPSSTAPSCETAVFIQ